MLLLGTPAALLESLIEVLTPLPSVQSPAHSGRKLVMALVLGSPPPMQEARTETLAAGCGLAPSQLLPALGE